MTSIFQSQNGLRLRFAKLGFASIVPATSQATSVLLAMLGNASRMTYFDNGLDADIALLAVHPDADPSVVTNRLLMTEIRAYASQNFEMGIFAGMSIDPKTQIYVYALTVPTLGSLRLNYWG